MNLSVLSSFIVFLSMLGWNVKSNSSSVFLNGNHSTKYLNMDNSIISYGKQRI